MAGWALGLAIVPCCGGITTLVGIGLAIAVLVKSRDGREHGKGLAIAALIIGGLWIIGTIVAVLLGAFNDLTEDADRDSSGHVTGRSEIAPTKLRVGDCFDDGALFGHTGDDDVEGSMVTVTPCTDAHQFEAYKVFEIPGDKYPGEERVGRMAEEGCLPAFRAFIGKAYGKSRIESYMYFPVAVSWRLLDDHEVTCVVGRPGELTTGTLKRSRR